MNDYKFSDIKIGSFVTIGAHSCILPGSQIPEGTALGAYTLIKNTSKLEAYHLYAGTDCRDLGKRNNIEKLRKFK